MDSSQSALIQNYQSILEKTNQQLSLWSNPYGVAIGILTAFIGILAILVAYAIYRNSKEQREFAKAFFEEQEKIIKQSNKRIISAEAKLDALLIGYEKKLKSASKKNKVDIQNAIEELKKEKASIGAYFTPGGTATSYPSSASGVTGPWVSGVSQSLVTRMCSNCAKTYSSRPSFPGELLPCIYCGFLN